MDTWLLVVMMSVGSVGFGKPPVPLLSEFGSRALCEYAATRIKKMADEHGVAHFSHECIPPTVGGDEKRLGK